MSFHKNKNFFHPPSHGIIIDKKSPFDFDTLDDNEIGEFLCQIIYG